MSEVNTEEFTLKSDRATTFKFADPDHTFFFEMGDDCICLTAAELFRALWKLACKEDK